MEYTDKPTGKIITFLPPFRPGEPNPFDKVEPTAGFAAMPPFVLPDPSTIPPREWLYGRHYIRDFVSATVAAGGTGKSSLTIAEALAMATGRNLIGVEPCGRSRVWMWNGEDPQVELVRRVAAACLHYRISQADLDGYFFLANGRDNPWSMATQTRDGLTIQELVIEDMIGKLEANEIDVAIIDPFVACQQVNENDNGAIAAVTAKWGYVADRAHCAVMLVHHARKTPPGTELTMEDMRGASALLAGVRSGRALNPMSQAFGARHGIANPKAYLRVNAASEKSNMTEARIGDDWYQFVSVDLHNGVLFPVWGGGPIPSDRVGVVTKWEPPDILDGVDAEGARRAQTFVGDSVFRLNQQARNWVGIPVAKALTLDIGLDASGLPKPVKEIGTFQAAARQKVKAVLEDWIAEGWFKVVEEKDAERKTRKFVIVGEPAESMTEALTAGVLEENNDDDGNHG